MNKKYERLLAEKKDDAAQRSLHEKGVDYSDKPYGGDIYQVWHDIAGPNRRIANVLNGAETSFPAGYVHVANVRTASLEQAVEMTTVTGSILDAFGNWQPWEKKPGTEALVIGPRSTAAGDVIVDPQGRVHRVEGNGFTEIFSGEKPLEKLETLADLKKAFQKNLDEKMEVPAVGKRKDNGIER
jgi:hypothetical protein